MAPQNPTAALERIDSLGSMDSVDSTSTFDVDGISVVSNTTTSSKMATKASLTCGLGTKTAAVLFIFGSVLVFTSIGLCLTTAFVTLNWEDLSFHEDFSANAMTLFDHVGTKGYQNLKLLESFSNTIMTTSKDGRSSSTTDEEGINNSFWPFVRVPSFESQGSNIVELMNISRVIFSPIVSDINRQEWEANSMSPEDNTTSTQAIFKINEEDGERVTEAASSGPYLPTWQLAPTSFAGSSSSTNAAENFNLLSLPSVAKAFESVQIHGAPVMSQPLSPTEVELMDRLDLIPIDRESTDDYREPMILLITPVNSDSAATNTQAVGVLVTPFVWGAYLTNAFSTGSKGIEVVVKNQCGKAFTYKVDDKHAVYKGEGDFHTTYFDHLVQSSSFSEMLQATANIPFTETACPYTMHITPSAVFMNQHTTNHPVLATVFAVSFFSFIFILSLVYISYTQSQIKKQTKNATRTSKLVNALFPKEVQKRMFREIEEKDAANAFLKGDGKHSDPFSRAKAYMKENENHDNGDMPIADLWTDCSVIFADIKGFTAWSACRSPSEVFHLLETLYGEFDKKAKRRGVFKVT